jgi:hypothetical protein
MRGRPEFWLMPKMFNEHVHSVRRNALLNMHQNLETGDEIDHISLQFPC